MSLAVGPYGIEYDPRSSDERSPALAWLVSLVVAVSFVSLVVTVVGRVRSRAAEEPPPEAQPVPAQEKPPAGEPPAPEEPPPPPIEVPAAEKRPQKLQICLLRLQEAEKKHDVEMSVSTIEQIRALPGQPAADIDDELARRLGELNVKWLFELKNKQWVEDVRVKAGDSATRIAREHASTLASFRRLNESVDADRLKAGATVKVMKHPRFNLVVHSRARMADLQLNGKFFKRYDLRDAVTGAPGAYESEGNLRQLLAEKGVWFNREDRTELETLLPKGASLTISEL